MIAYKYADISMIVLKSHQNAFGGQLMRQVKKDYHFTYLKEIAWFYKHISLNKHIPMQKPPTGETSNANFEFNEFY